MLCNVKDICTTWMMNTSNRQSYCFIKKIMKNKKHYSGISSFEQKGFKRFFACGSSLELNDGLSPLSGVWQTRNKITWIDCWFKDTSAAWEFDISCILNVRVDHQPGQPGGAILAAGHAGLDVISKQYFWYCKGISRTTGGKPRSNLCGDKANQMKQRTNHTTLANRLWARKCNGKCVFRDAIKA